ncbi:MAG: hypothetical protein Q8918_19225 [Bacteroidota bacterium]|nr:hypothetical protein [Bacteroidota bacterium]
MFFLFATGIGLTLLSGTYPALVISRFDPVAAIKSKINTNAVSGIFLRRSLIVLQFVIAQLLIIGTLVIVSQMDYFRNRPMGFDRKNVWLLSLPGGKQNTQQYAYFKSRVLQVPGVLDASLCGDAPSTNGYWQTNFTFENHVHPEDFELVMRPADSSYLSTFRISMVAGRLPESSDSSVREVVMNENAAVRLGFKNPADIIGHFIRMTFQKNQPMFIVGVVRNFNSGPLRESMKPVLLFNDPRNFGTLAIRLDPMRISSSLPKLQAIFGQIFPGQFFDAAFFDDTVVNFYHAEAIASILFRIFAGLAIFISCLGLYGLVSFMAVQKTREVGIRKVLGASVQSIVFIFSREFTVLVGIAFLISAPIGYYMMHRWLSGFYFHIPLGISVFGLAAFLSAGIAWITVAYKAVKAAIANPARSLRSE